MSSIADFRLIDIAKLDQLKENAKPVKGFLGRVKDNFYTYLNANSVGLKEYPWSGYVYSTLIEYLNEKDINLEVSGYSHYSDYLTEVRKSYFLILDKAIKEKYIEKLNPSVFDEAELARYYCDFNETEEEEGVGKATMDAISGLYENLKMADDDKVIVFSI